MNEHTPTPWEVGGPYPSVSIIYTAEPGHVAQDNPEPPRYEPVCILHQSRNYKTPPPERALADAVHIVHCVNWHERLVEAVRMAELKLDKYCGGTKMASGTREVLRGIIAELDAECE